MGAVQLGFSGGEPLVRQDLTELVKHARQLGYFSNLITSGYGMTEAKIVELKEAGLDHIQVSIQSPEKTLNDELAGTESYDHKKEVARLVKKNGYPMVLCVVIHRKNIKCTIFWQWLAIWAQITLNWPTPNTTAGLN